MPFKSEAQRRLFHAKADRGEISQETVDEWERATKHKGKLPMYKRKKHADLRSAIQDLRSKNMALNAGNVARGGPSMIAPRTNAEAQQQQLDVRGQMLQRGQRAAMKQFGVQSLR